MKSLFLTIAFIGLTVCAEAQTWTLVYENDKDGIALSGSVEELRKAVRNGLPIRVGWGSPQSVEHVADAKFLTIMKGDVVFAQIDPIFGQTPKMDEDFIELKEGMSWVMIAASNGKSDAMMTETSTGKALSHNQRTRGFKWFVRKG